MENRKANIDPVWRAMPWLRPKNVQHFTSRIFKSGNSLAVRIPAGTELAAGMEMSLTVKDGQFLSFEPVVSPKRKFDIAKVAGSARDLQFIRDEDRVFQDRPLIWPPLRDSGSRHE